jgi:hypothetical protein
LSGWKTTASFRRAVIVQERKANDLKFKEDGIMVEEYATLDWTQVKSLLEEYRAQVGATVQASILNSATQACDCLLTPAIPHPLPCQDPPVTVPELAKKYRVEESHAARLVKHFRMPRILVIARDDVHGLWN